MSTTIEEMWEAVFSVVLAEAVFEESKHPREEKTFPITIDQCCMCDTYP
jgi:hypothetical protein